MNMSSSFSEVPIMILTATATVEVKEVFQRILRQPIQEVASVNRSNVSLNVKELQKLPKKGVN